MLCTVFVRHEMYCMLVSSWALQPTGLCSINLLTYLPYKSSQKHNIEILLIKIWFYRIIAKSNVFKYVENLRDDYSIQ